MKGVFSKTLDYYFRKLFQKLGEKKRKEVLEKIKSDVLSGYVTAKSRGKITQGMEKMIEHLFKKVRDWRKVLREEVLDVIKGDFSWRKISDNLQALHLAGFRQIGNLPSMDDSFSIPDIYIGIDVSGSIGDEEYKDFLNEIYSIFKSVKVGRFEIVLWEAEVTKTFVGRNGFVSKALEWLKERKGYGGTVLKSFLEYCDKRGNLNKVAVILTDGYFESDITHKDFKNFRKVIFVVSKNGITDLIPKSPKIKVLKIR